MEYCHSNVLKLLFYNTVQPGLDKVFISLVVMTTICKQISEEPLFPKVKGTLPKTQTTKHIFRYKTAIKTSPGS